MIRVLVIVGMAGLGACTGPDGAAVTAPGAAVTAIPGTDAVGDREDLDTPNSFPAQTRPGTTVGVETDVVGVTHLPPI